MFRRVYSSQPIPKAMYSSLKISSSAQANRMLPSMCILPAVCSMHTMIGSMPTSIASCVATSDLEAGISPEAISQMLSAMEGGMGGALVTSTCIGIKQVPMCCGVQGNTGAVLKTIMQCRRTL